MEQQTIREILPKEAFNEHTLVENFITIEEHDQLWQRITSLACRKDISRLWKEIRLQDENIKKVTNYFQHTQLFSTQTLLKMKSWKPLNSPKTLHQVFQVFQCL